MLSSVLVQTALSQAISPGANEAGSGIQGSVNIPGLAALPKHPPKNLSPERQAAIVGL